MKKIVLLILSLFVVFGLSACDDVCIGPECVLEAGETPDGEEPQDCEDNGETGEGILVDNAIPFTHVNGHGEETEKYAFILMEWKLRDYVKYQIAYLACTCRPADFNYWNIAYVEINTYTNDIRTISFDVDGEGGHYYPGAWGDSSGDENQNYITQEDFEAEMIPWLIGKTSEDLAGITLFANGVLYDTVDANTTSIDDMTSDGSELLVDAFAGSSVSSNNMIRVMKELLKYHEEKYEN